MPRGSYRVNTLAVPADMFGGVTPPPSGVTSMTFVQSQTFTASSFIYPSEMQVGDFCILFDASPTTTDVTPTGFTSITKALIATTYRQNISYRILQSGDATGVLKTGLGGSARKVVLLFRPNVPITSVSFTIAGTQATTSVPTNQTILGQAGPVIAFACYSSTGNVTTRGWTAGSPTEVSVVSTSSNYVKYLITNSGTPANTTVSMTDNGNNALQSFMAKFT